MRAVRLCALFACMISATTQPQVHHCRLCARRAGDIARVSQHKRARLRLSDLINVLNVSSANALLTCAQVRVIVSVLAWHTKTKKTPAIKPNTKLTHVCGGLRVFGLVWRDDGRTNYNITLPLTSRDSSRAFARIASAFALQCYTTAEKYVFAGRACG